MTLSRLTLCLICLLLPAGTAVAALSDYVSNGCDYVTYTAAEAGSFAEQYGSISALKQQVKIGSMGDVNFAKKAAAKAAKAAKKAEKLKKKADKMQKLAKKAEKYKKKAEKIKARAEKMKAKAEKYAAKANNLKDKATKAVDKAKNAYSDAKEKIDEGKELYNEGKAKFDETKEMIDEAEVMAASLPAVAGGLAGQAKEKANSAASKVSGAERQPFAASSDGPVSAVSADEIAAKVEAMPEVVPMSEPEPTAADKAAVISTAATTATGDFTPMAVTALPEMNASAKLTADEIVNAAAVRQAAPEQTQLPLAKSAKSLEEQLTADSAPVSGETAAELDERLRAADVAKLADYPAPDPNASAKSNAKMQAKDIAKNAERGQNRRRNFGSPLGETNE